jgi:hypothetical protein
MRATTLAVVLPAAGAPEQLVVVESGQNCRVGDIFRDTLWGYRRP